MSTDLHFDQLLPSPIGTGEVDWSVDFTGAWVRRFRTGMGRTQAEFGAMLGIHHSNVSRMEAETAKVVGSDYVEKLKSLVTSESTCPNCWWEEPGPLFADEQDRAHGYEPEEELGRLHSPADLSPEALTMNEGLREEACIRKSYLGPLRLPAFRADGQPVRWCRYCGASLTPSLCPSCFSQLPADSKQRVCELCGLRLSPRAPRGQGAGQSTSGRGGPSGRADCKWLAVPGSKEEFHNSVFVDMFGDSYECFMENFIEHDRD